MTTSSNDSPRGESARRFDAQAKDFDERAGIGRGSAVDIAAGLVRMAGPVPGGHHVVEIGAGTGEVGQYLAALCSRYVGIDASRPMLGVFSSRLADRTDNRRPPLLVQADADRDWPLLAGSVTLVFASRVAHLLDTTHVMAESRRVCQRGGGFFVGRVERTGVKEVLRAQREAILTRRGLGAGRSGRRRTQRLLDSFVAGGARPEPALTVASWTSSTTAAHVIAGWGAMPSMGGENLDSAIRAAVLDELGAWAASRLGDLDRPQAFTETYVVEGVRLL